jgi:hypothetical protein
VQRAELNVERPSLERGAAVGSRGTVHRVRRG